MLRQTRFLFLLPALLLFACSFTPEQPVPKTKEETGLIQIRPSTSSRPAVLKLLEKARRAAKAGQFDVAEAQLERALRIEPRNATLWHYMARLRLEQGRMEQAAGLAARSNSFEHDDASLQANNWRIIAHARYQQGDIEAANAAQARADALAAD